MCKGVSPKHSFIIEVLPETITSQNNISVLTYTQSDCELQQFLRTQECQGSVKSLSEFICNSVTSQSPSDGGRVSLHSCTASHLKST